MEKAAEHAEGGCKIAEFNRVKHSQQALMATAGVASDALKVAEYRSALRLRSQMPQLGAWSSSADEAAYKNFSRILSKACYLSPMKCLQLWHPSSCRH